jgi:hypothetical protein
MGAERALGLVCRCRGKEGWFNLHFPFFLSFNFPRAPANRYKKRYGFVRGKKMKREKCGALFEEITIETPGFTLVYLKCPCCNHRKYRLF